MEQTLVVLKPDAVQRGIVGEIINRFEKTGLKIIGAKMFVPDDTILNKHYPEEREEWVAGLGQRTLNNYTAQGIDPEAEFGSKDPGKIGKAVRQWLVDFMASGPVLALVIEGPHAIGIVRKMIGDATPSDALPGTIRGDFSFDSAAIANREKRPIKNLIHASGNSEEAAFEVGLWFSASELYNYEAVHQKHMVSE